MALRNSSGVASVEMVLQARKILGSQAAIRGG